MTTDTTALQERIARALYENAEYYGPEDAQPSWDLRDNEERGEWMEIAAAVLPVIAAEVRKAQADTLRQAADEDSETLYSVAGWEMQAVEADELRRRATTIEQED